MAYKNVAFKTFLYYKGFEGAIHYDFDTNLYWGHVLRIDDVVAFESDTLEHIMASFRDAVDNYTEYLNYKKNRISLRQWVQKQWDTYSKKFKLTFLKRYT